MHVHKLHNDPNFIVADGIYYQRDFTKSDFEESYITIREKEGRLLSDEEVFRLPELRTPHPLAKEWSIRKSSTQKLLHHLNKISGTKAILEVGCGNGWLTHQLSTLQSTSVIGLDVNQAELKQAASVFNATPTIYFVMGDLFTIQFPMQFDVIILASSIQYFANLEKLLSVLFSILSEGGEIHIVDSPFYSAQNVADAKSRSSRYFQSMNSKMDDHYHHHSLTAFATYHHTVLYNPGSLLSKFKNIFVTRSPFPWIKIERAQK